MAPSSNAVGLAPSSFLAAIALEWGVAGLHPCCELVLSSPRSRPITRSRSARRMVCGLRATALRVQHAPNKGAKLAGADAVAPRTWLLGVGWRSRGGLLDGVILIGDADGNAASLTRGTCDESAVLELDDHAVDGGRCDFEEGLDVRLRRRAPLHERVAVDEGQVRALRLGESRNRSTLVRPHDRWSEGDHHPRQLIGESRYRSLRSPGAALASTTNMSAKARRRCSFSSMPIDRADTRR